MDINVFLFGLLDGLFSLLKGTLLNFPLVLALVLAGVGIHRFVRARWKLAWIHSVFIACVLEWFALLVVLYFVPSLSLIGSAGNLPAAVASLQAPGWVMALLALVRLGLVASVLSVLSLTGVLLGAFVMEWLKRGISNFWIRFGVSVYAVLLMAFAFWLYVFPGLFLALVYFVYFWPQ
ncbi:MAG: hypothetical protein HY917_00935 [Candidatus Diapherotrites archaeon]|nr:hypothetical protein [Candidatus Diapherotrites archaeon]